MRRTAAQLLDAAAVRRAERQRLAAQRQAQELARQEQRAALAREKRLTNLVGQQEQTWLRVTALIDTKKPHEYDTAVELLKDLRAVSQRTGSPDEFSQRLALLRQQHQRKSSLIERFNHAGLTA